MTTYISHATWSAERPHTLVVACSDGRLQRNIDDFLRHELGIENYDRVYVPGGPGALATSGGESSRTHTLRSEMEFLLRAHAIEHLILLFHGGAPDGPDIATCADYSRKFAACTPAKIRELQNMDAAELLQHVSGWPRNLRISIYRAEVTAEGWVQFVDLGSDNHAINSR